jgi:MerR family transcriptional regulator, copper efflux regulator
VASVTDLRISQLAERSGVPASTLRFYESAGLLPAGRTPAGYRVYDETALERLQFIGTAKRWGLPLEEIAELLQTWASGSCAAVRADLRPRLAARIAEAGRCDSRCGFPGPGPGAGAEEAWRIAAVACTLDGEDMRQRAVQWRTLLDGAHREPIPGGLRLTLPADRAAEIAELAVAEQRCCAF